MHRQILIGVFLLASWVLAAPPSGAAQSGSSFSFGPWRITAPVGKLVAVPKVKKILETTVAAPGNEFVLVPVAVVNTRRAQMLWPLLCVKWYFMDERGYSFEDTGPFYFFATTELPEGPLLYGDYPDIGRPETTYKGFIVFEVKKGYKQIYLRFEKRAYCTGGDDSRAGFIREDTFTWRIR